MSANTKGLVEKYLDWVKGHSSEREVGAGWSALSFPFVDRHNDFLQVFVREDRDGYLITDEGRTIRDLKRIGCDLKSKTKRRSLAASILRGLGLDPALLNSEEIATKAVNGEFPHKLNNILMSMMAIDGLAVATPSSVLTLFKEDVTDWLRTIGVKFEAGGLLTGKSENSYGFDFVIPARADGRESVVQTFDKADTIYIESFTYRVIDVREGVQGQWPEFYAMFSDSSAPNSKNRRALLTQGIDPWVWSERDQLARKLVA